MNQAKAKNTYWLSQIIEECRKDLNLAYALIQDLAVYYPLHGYYTHITADYNRLVLDCSGIFQYQLRYVLQPSV
jgi:hypothetical protein